jgi:hypothetical protein
MASTPANAETTLPLFYGSLVPLSSQLHPKHGLKPRGDFGYTRAAHAIPITVDEFAMAQRHYPIIFSVGENPTPLALVGLQEGKNLYLGADDQWEPGHYIPAFVRRYPFLLAKLFPDATELSLCFDETSGMLAADVGEPMFNGTEQTQTTTQILDFCEQFEQAVMRTRSFMDEIVKLGLLMDGEVTIQREGLPQPAVYRGFQMVAEDRLQNLRGDQARKLVQSGLLGLCYAHLFSLALISPLFEKQFAAGSPVRVPVNMG